jgi:GGDEF domain-containing protein
VSMLGYTAKRNSWLLNLTSGIICDSFKRQQLLGSSGQVDPSDSLEIDWKRKDGSRLNGEAQRTRSHSAQTEGLSGYEIIAEDVTKQRELEHHLRQLAAKDSLTGLANYRSLVGALDSEIKRSKRSGREFALLLFDLDDLKKINDRYGHVAGSQALCRLADALSMGCRDTDTAARFGGDEFALVLPETCLESADLVSQRICRQLCKRPPGPAAFGQCRRCPATLRMANRSKLF